MHSSNFRAVFKVFVLICLTTSVVYPRRYGDKPKPQSQDEKECRKFDPLGFLKVIIFGFEIQVLKNKKKDQIVGIFNCFNDSQVCLENAFISLQDDFGLWDYYFFANTFRNTLRANIRPGEVKYPREFCATLSDEMASSTLRGLITSKGENEIMPTSIFEAIATYKCLSVLQRYFSGSKPHEDNGGRSKQSIVYQVFDKECTDVDIYKCKDDYDCDDNPDYPYIMASYVSHVAVFHHYVGDLPSPFHFCRDPRVLSDYRDHQSRINQE